MRKLFVALMLLVLFIAPAYAENWVNMGSNGKNTGWLDTDATTDLGGGIVRIKTKIVPDAPNGEWDYFIMIMELNCNVKSQRTIRYIYYKGPGPGQEYAAGEEDLEWRRILPGSNAESLSDRSCRYKMIEK